MCDADGSAATVARLTRERDEARESLAWWTEPQPCDLRHSEPFDFGSCETHDRTFPLGGTCDHAGLSEVEWMEQREHQQRQRAIRAEQERDEARAESDETHAILERLSDLLTRTVNTLRGDPPPLVAWSWHDIPDLAAAVIAERDEARANPRDEYHTMSELYEYRMLYNALAANAMPDRAVKSWRHSDGEECFGGGWFVVYLNLPTGQVSNHYRAEHWGLFRVPEVDRAPEWDGHTPHVAAERLRDALGVPGQPPRPEREIKAEALREYADAIYRDLARTNSSSTGYPLVLSAVSALRDRADRIERGDA